MGGLVVSKDEGNVGLAGSLTHHLYVDVLLAQYSEDTLENLRGFCDIADEGQDGIPSPVRCLGNTLEGIHESL